MISSAGIRARQDDLRALGASRDVLDHGADAVAHRVVLGAGLILALDDGLDAPDLDDDVTLLEALDGAAHHLAPPFAELAEHVLALGFADLLEDHLLGGLRGDAPEILRSAGELHLHVDLGLVAVEGLRLAQRDFRRRVLDVGHDLLDRAQLDFTARRVEARAQDLVLVLLAGRGLDRILQRLHHDLRVDPLFLGQGFDELLQLARHDCSPPAASP